MQDKELRDKIISLIKKEVVPALGCTEPVAVSLCVAKATEMLGELPEKIEVSLSGNMLKNAMGVGIPGTGMTGLPIAIALGALKGKSEYGLEVLKDVTSADVEKGKEYIAEGRINIYHDPDTPSNLYIRVKVSSDNGKKTAEAIIGGLHTNFLLIKKGDEEILKKELENHDEHSTEDVPVLDLKTVYEFATTAPIEEIEFILEARRLNGAAAQYALENDCGHSLGYLMQHNIGKNLFGDSVLAHIVSATSAACDARMGGAQVPVMSNSGSGNQGICATMPVVSFAKDCGANEEQLIRALTLSHLTSIYIKQSLGRLSALCGCVVASTGASSGITYLMGGGFDEISSAIKNMVANLAGMLCDGAKPSCSLKISSGVSTALISAMLAMNDRCVKSSEGIVDNDVDKTVRNLTSIGREAMQETDRLVLKIMTSK